MAKRTRYEWHVTFSDGKTVTVVSARVDKACEAAIMQRFAEMGSMEYSRRDIRMTAWPRGAAVENK